jgi:hypothetical protein
MFFKISLKVHKIQRRKKFIHGIQQINTIPCEKQYFMKCSEVLDDYQNAPLQKQLSKDQKHHQEQLQKQKVVNSR